MRHLPNVRFVTYYYDGTDPALPRKGWWTTISYRDTEVLGGFHGNSPQESFVKTAEWFDAHFAGQLDAGVLANLAGLREMRKAA